MSEIVEIIAPCPECGTPECCVQWYVDLDETDPSIHVTFTEIDE